MISSKEGQTFFSIRMKNRKKAASMKLPTAIRIQGVFLALTPFLSKIVHTQPVISSSHVMASQIYNSTLISIIGEIRSIG